MSNRIASLQGSGGGRGGGCFLGHVPVATPDGSRRIDELKVGDQVLSFDDQGAIHAATILKVHEHENEKVTRYKLWGGEHLDATPNHWVLNQFNAFVEIGTLGPDDCLVDWNNHLRPIVGKEDLGTGTVYNLTVEGHHTFIAGGIRVHNAGLGLGIAGAGGGGGGGGKGGGGSRTPYESDDSLQSTQFASVLDLISEGEIEGFDDDTKSIYLEGTPVTDASGTNNFRGWTIVARFGTQTQTAIGGSDNRTEQEFGVGVQLFNGVPITRQITDTDIDRVRVTVNVPQLQQIDDDGDILGFNVEHKIEVQYNGGGYSEVLRDNIAGKTGNLYQRDYMIKMDGAFPVDIRLTRLSGDETSAKKSNDIFWSSYTEIIDEKLRYPNSAMVGLRFDSREFNNIPARKYLIRGIKVQLPSNATVDTSTHLGRVTYSGIWDGTFGAATWCNDPAWCLWDLLTNTRYGAGIPASNLDRYDFFAISQYCNELVDDGNGGTEPRFSCNLLLNSRDEVYNVIQEMTSLFRGISYYGAGSLVLLQDKPADSQYLLGPSNVVEGIFSYSGTSQKARHTTATVAWQSYETLGEIEYEYVEDADAVAKHGIINKDIKALGCYSQGQAHRAGKWALLSEQTLTETVSFSVAIDSGIILRPGMVIDIADPLKAGSRRSGRISSATTTVITVDSTTDLSVDTTKSPTLSVLLPTGLVETRGISEISGADVTVSSAFSEAPNDNSIWMIETTDLQSQQYRVLAVAESGDGIYGVTALEYNASIYDAIETNNKLTDRDISNLSAKPDAVSSIESTEFLYQRGQSVFSGVDLSWISSRQRVNEFRVSYRIDNDNWTLVNTTSPSVRIEQTRAGKLYVQITAANYLGKVSEISTAEFTLLGKTAVPGQVQNLRFEATSDKEGTLRWNETVDLDVKVGGKVYIRHSSKTDGSASWSDSVDLIEAVAGSSTSAKIPLVEGEVFAKFADDGGRLSTNETSVIIDLPDTLGKLQVIDRKEDLDSPPFQGAKVDCFYDSGYEALTMGGGDIDDIDDFDEIAYFDILGDVVSSATYTFNDTQDLGAVYSLDLKRYFVTRGYYPADSVDNRAENIDDWDNWDGDVVDKVNATLQVRHTADDPSGTPTWTDWKEFVNGTFKGRGFQFRTVMTSSDVAQSILIDELGYEAEFQRRSEQANGAVASGTGGKAISFDSTFFTGTSSLGGVNAYLPSIGINAQNMQSGDYFTLSSVSGTGFTVEFFNSSDTSIDRNFSWSAVGFGKGG